MAKFKYRMQNILEIKYKLEEQAKQEYADQRQKVTKAERDLQQLLERKTFYQKKYQELVVGALRLKEIEECKTGIEVLHDQIVHQKRLIQELEEQLELARLKLKEVMQDRKVHESLREKEFETFLKELDEIEKKEIDELVSYKYNSPKEEEK